MHRSHFRAGELIFAEGDPPTTAFVIETGTVQIATSRQGVECVLGNLGPSALLGEMAVIDDSPRSASAHALTDCVLTPIDRQQFGERVANSDPVVRTLLLSQLDRYRSALATLTGAPGESSLGKSEDAPAIAKIRLESELRGALDRNELEVWLQPVVEIESARIVGYEALIRWMHNERGPVPPAEFIALAEETSLIVPIGDFVLGRVCDMLAEFARCDEPLPFIALNVSARQLRDPDLIDQFVARLAARNLPTAALKVEITESLIMEQARVADLITRCHAVGIQVALDDFGTGWSNLGPLLALDFDQVKLDQQFVRALDTPRGDAIVAAIADLAHALGCDLIAEGVETAEHRAALNRLGCRFGQGWLFGRPLTLKDILVAR